VEAVLAVPGVIRVEPRLVWEPRWDPGMIRQDAW
jgi:metal-sulfur cluster biosynthetic enzyme